MGSLFKEHQQALEMLCDQYDILYLGVFGSYARGEASDTSDLDLLVEFADSKSAFELLRIKRELEQLLEHPVDLVLQKYLDPHIKPYALKDLQTIIQKEVA